MITGGGFHVNRKRNTVVRGCCALFAADYSIGYWIWQNKYFVNNFIILWAQLSPVPAEKKSEPCSAQLDGIPVSPAVFNFFLLARDSPQMFGSHDSHPSPSWNCGRSGTLARWRPLVHATSVSRSCSPRNQFAIAGEPLTRVPSALRPFLQTCPLALLVHATSVSQQLY